MLKRLKLTDYIIIVLIIAVCITGSYVFFKKKDLSNLPVEKDVKIMFDVIFRGVSISSKYAPFKPGDDAFITIRNVPYKKLKINSIDGARRMTYVPSKNKQGFEKAEDISAPSLYDFIVRLECDAKKTPDGYTAGGNKIKMGIPIIIEGELYRYQGPVSNIFEVQEQEKSAE